MFRVREVTSSGSGVVGLDLNYCPRLLAKWDFQYRLTKNGLFLVEQNKIMKYLTIYITGYWLSLKHVDFSTLELWKYA